MDQEDGLTLSIVRVVDLEISFGDNRHSLPPPVSAPSQPSGYDAKRVVLRRAMTRIDFGTAPAACPQQQGAMRL
jgi:hypothetical protein